MTELNEIKSLLIHEIKREVKQKELIASAVLNAIITIFIIYLTVKVVDKTFISNIFWIVVLFSTVNITTKLFLSEKKGKALYLHQLVNPQSIIVSRVLFNAIYVSLLSFIILLFIHLFLDIYFKNIFEIIVTNILTSIGISTVYTLTSSIATKAKNSGILATVLSIPLLLPILLIGVKLSKTMLEKAPNNNTYIEWAILFGVDTMMLILAYILFKQIWKE